MSKIIGYSLGVIIVFTAFFYFYPADIFEVEITEGMANYSMDVSLKGILDNTQLPEAVSQSNLAEVSPTAKGWMLLIICLIGIPIMIGYRLATANTPKPKTEN